MKIKLTAAIASYLVGPRIKERRQFLRVPIRPINKNVLGWRDFGSTLCPQNTFEVAETTFWHKWV